MQIHIFMNTIKEGEDGGLLHLQNIVNAYFDVDILYNFMYYVYPVLSYRSNYIFISNLAAANNIINTAITAIRTRVLYI